MKTGNDLLVLMREKTVNFARMSKFEIKMFLSTTNGYLKYSIWNPRLCAVPRKNIISCWGFIVLRIFKLFKIKCFKFNNPHKLHTARKLSCFYANSEKIEELKIWRNRFNFSQFSSTQKHWIYKNPKSLGFLLITFQNKKR